MKKQPVGGTGRGKRMTKVRRLEEACPFQRTDAGVAGGESWQTGGEGEEGGWQGKARLPSGRSPSLPALG